ncbi:MAG: hypothetical protein K0Q92_253 [Steroidobacteraceae bacterium]|nr:hypothetical protein [Steroidobacteraceae bacterium]
MLLAALVAAAAVARAQNPPPEFAIDAQDADMALTLFSDQSRLQILFDYNAVQGGRRARSADGARGRAR